VSVELLEPPHAATTKDRAARPATASLMLDFFMFGTPPRTEALYLLLLVLLAAPPREAALSSTMDTA
jgi:hypothetical protein